MDDDRPTDPEAAPPNGAAARALEEAAARRAAHREERRPREVDGRAGPEPVRYGDWEKNGIATDF